MDDDHIPTRSAAEAFDAMGDRMALLTRAVEGIAAEKARAPDYTETLGEIMARLNHHRDAINTLGNRPAMKLTIAMIAEQVVTAADDARRQDAAMLREACKAMEQATASMAHWAQSAHVASEQKRYILRTIGITAAATICIMAIIPGVIFRELPTSWLLPERSAARMMRRDRWAAGERLLVTADLDR